MSSSFCLKDYSEAAVQRFAEELAFLAMPGDLICLTGDLGAGKTTFARAFIRAMHHGNIDEVPSPTYTLVQTYEAERFSVAHLDLYRLSEPDEINELGIEQCLEDGVALIEWPDKAGDLLPTAAFEIQLDDTGTHNSADRRHVKVSGPDAQRIKRLEALHNTIKAAGWYQPEHLGSHNLYYLQGDASARRYARLKGDTGSGAIVMDWPEQPDGPPIRDGKPYSQIAHLAENVQPFLAVTQALREAGLRAPNIYAYDIDNGFIVLEDFGNDVFQTAVETGTPPDKRWRAATDVLIHLHQNPPAQNLPVVDGQTYLLPTYDTGALGIETELLVDWYWPAVKGEDTPADVRDQFMSGWHELFEKLTSTPPNWVLRDFHSPNLILLDSNDALSKVGLIDVQDAMRGPAAYDLVSLLQDARVTIDAKIETELLNHYCQCMMTASTDFNEDEFRLSYAILGAQRNTKILGIFARLASRDGKPRYLEHIPRIWAYLERNLTHPALHALKVWYDKHFPVEKRRVPPRIS